MIVVPFTSVKTVEISTGNCYRHKILYLFYCGTLSHIIVLEGHCEPQSHWICMIWTWKILWSQLNLYWDMELDRVMIYAKWCCYLEMHCDFLWQMWTLPYLFEQTTHSSIYCCHLMLLFVTTTNSGCANIHNENLKCRLLYTAYGYFLLPPYLRVLFILLLDTFEGHRNPSHNMVCCSLFILSCGEIHTVKSVPNEFLWWWLFLHLSWGLH
jgi:hypothetical protein